jgi:hypothetical protein
MCSTAIDQHKRRCESSRLCTCADTLVPTGAVGKQRTKSANLAMCWLQVPPVESVVSETIDDRRRPVVRSVCACKLHIMPLETVRVRRHLCDARPPRSSRFLVINALLRTHSQQTIHCHSKNGPVKRKTGGALRPTQTLALTDGVAQNEHALTEHTRNMFRRYGARVRFNQI